MNIQVLFFGATADITGQRRVELELPADSRSADILETVVAEYPRLAAHRLHLSVNQAFADGNELLNDGDELAIFTAVSGG
jgi:molybdopterin converting factor small subunit